MVSVDAALKQSPQAGRNSTGLQVKTKSSDWKELTENDQKDPTGLTEPESSRDLDSSKHASARWKEIDLLSPTPISGSPPRLSSSRSQSTELLVTLPASNPAAQSVTPPETPAATSPSPHESSELLSPESAKSFAQDCLELDINGAGKFETSPELQREGPLTPEHTRLHHLQRSSSTVRKDGDLAALRLSEPASASEVAEELGNSEIYAMDPTTPNTAKSSAKRPVTVTPGSKKSSSSKRKLLPGSARKSAGTVSGKAQ
eukprot:gb/GEZN01009562.1/.p1 GENE.gb/GEZN01009562.1/~~gb/GEZN01009562.1/.p1  ORF type:complete len:259 (+),score=37.36 gb/GEZN01009562.1/:399-1175(+)